MSVSLRRIKFCSLAFLIPESPWIWPPISGNATLPPNTSDFAVTCTIHWRDPPFRMCSDASRWHIYDTMTRVIYGVPVGMVDKGRDVDRLIGEWHRVFTLGGLIATLPWLLGPIINYIYLKPFLMPSEWHGHGTGHIMRVGGNSRPFQCVPLPRFPC